MDLSELLTAHDGPAYCHVPGDGPIDLDKLAGGDDGNERWNDPGQPTLYLAGDVGVVIAELARHLDPAGSLDGDATRRLLRLHVAVDRLLDLREPQVRRALDAPDDRRAFLDRAVARRTAGAARSRPDVLGLITPSMAFLDRPARHNVVVFVDRVEGGTRGIVVDCSVAGRVALDQSAAHHDSTR